MSGVKENERVMKAVVNIQLHFNMSHDSAGKISNIEVKQ